MDTSSFMVTPGTGLADLRVALAADSPYDQIVFAAGHHLFAGTVTVAKPGVRIHVSNEAVLSPLDGVPRLFDIRAAEVEISGTGRLDGADQALAPGFRQFIYVRDTADGFHIAGAAKPTQADQSGALIFTGGRVAVEIAGADNIILENLHLHDFRPGTYGIILRDVGIDDGLNALGETGNIVRDIYARSASGGGLPGQHHVNGSWIRLDTSANGTPTEAPQIEGVMITDNILLGGEAGLDETGRKYFFVNIDSNIEAAHNIEIAFNTLANAVSYEIQIKNGYPSQIGVQCVHVHDNIMAHAAPDLLRQWPLKVQSNYEAPFHVTFQNNFAVLREGLTEDDLLLSIGFAEDVGLGGDYVIDSFRPVVRYLPEAGRGVLSGSSGSDWMILGGAAEVISGAGQDLIDFRRGDGQVTVLDFEAGVDSMRFVGFGLTQVPQLLSSDTARNGVLRFGADTLILERDGARVDLSDLAPSDLIFHDTYTPIRIEAGAPATQGGADADLIEGSEGPDNMQGGAGDDLMRGNQGNDWLSGNEGSDRLVPGPGTDRIWGGVGPDSVVFGPGNGLNIVYDFDLQQDRIVLKDVSFADLIVLPYGDRDADIRLSDGSRLVLRNINPEELDSRHFLLSSAQQSGPLAGGTADDNLHGTHGDDIFATSPGVDRLYGYAGADTFVLAAGSGLNVVYDFEVGQDQISLLGLGPDDTTLLVYNETDLEIRSRQGDRLVLRNVEFGEVSLEDMTLQSPDDWATLFV